MDSFGVEHHEAEVTDVSRNDDGFGVTTDDETQEATYLVLATRAHRDLVD